MSIINRKKVKQFMKANDKQITEEAVNTLEGRMYSILRTAIKLTPGNKRVTNVEIFHAKG